MLRYLKLAAIIVVIALVSGLLVGLAFCSKRPPRNVSAPGAPTAETSTATTNASFDVGTISAARMAVEELLVTPKTIVLLGPNAQPLLVAPNPAITNPELQRPAALGYSYSGPPVEEVTKRLDGVEEKVSRLDIRVTAISDTLTSLTKGVGELKDIIKKNEATVQEWSLTAH